MAAEPPARPPNGSGEPGTGVPDEPPGRVPTMLTVSHGELFRRESTWEEGNSGTVAFRPEKYDLVVYNSLTEELRINAASESLREHYRKQFGFYLVYYPASNMLVKHEKSSQIMREATGWQVGQCTSTF